MPPSKRRRITEPSESTAEEVAHEGTAKDAATARPLQAASQTAVQIEESTEAKASELASDIAEKNKERQDRFKALQARAVSSLTDSRLLSNLATRPTMYKFHRAYMLTGRQKKSAERNLKEAAAESQRLATDPTLLSSLSRKQAFASHKLLKADTAAAGEDFERKRAWDWTIEESEKWDKRMEKKERHREDVAFQDYRQDSRKVYKRQLREMKPDVEAYEKRKMQAVQKAAQSGALEIVETDDGELVAVDKNGTFYSTADSTDFVENKPDRAAVDRLVTDLRKAEESRLRKRRDRGKGEEDGDVTYINDKNKVSSMLGAFWVGMGVLTCGLLQQFNQKLARFYNKVCAKISAAQPSLLTICAVYRRDSGQFRERHHDMTKGFSSRKATMRFGVENTGPHADTCAHSRFRKLRLTKAGL